MVFSVEYDLWTEIGILKIGIKLSNESELNKI